MSARKLKQIDATQATITHVFSVAAIKKAEETKATTPTVSKVTKTLSSENSRVQAFYDSLSPQEIIAHSIAVDKLGTSYDVTRTHGFLKWSKANPA